MTGPDRTPTERELAELAIAAECARSSPSEVLPLDEALRVLDDQGAAPEQRARVLRALNRDPTMYQSWLAGRRASVEFPALTPDPAPARQTAHRATSWFCSLFDWPWQTASATVSLLLVGFLAGHLATQRVTDRSVPAEGTAVPTGISSSGKGSAPVRFDAVRTADLTTDASKWLSDVRDACAARPDPASIGDWNKRALNLTMIWAKTHAASPPINETAPIKALDSLHDNVPVIGDEKSIRNELCNKDSIDIINDALKTPTSGS